MSRMTGLRGVVAVVAVLTCGPAFAIAYTSNNTGGGLWNNAATWSPAGVPGPGDTVFITGSDTVTLIDARTITSLELNTTSGSKTLDVTGGGNLTITTTGNALLISAPPAGNTNLVQISGGSINVSSGDISVVGGISSVARINFASAGTISTNQILFSGTPTNALIDFSGLAGDVQIGINLGAGGTITSAGSTFTFNGTGSQTINGYTFDNLVINKASGTATLNGPITVNGDLSVNSGVFDDGGNQITLNGGGTSNVTIGSSGVLKLGSAGNSTAFPNPIGGANVTMFPNAAVVYQGGQTGQIINIDASYRRLFLQAPGSTGPVNKQIASGTIKVFESLQIDDNATNTVTLMLGPEILDVDADINGDGEILVTSGSIFVGGSLASTISLSVNFPNTSTVTYDGTGGQSVLGTTYDNLVINKASGTATATSAITVNKDLTLTNGSFDDGGFQISLDSGLGSNISIDPTGVLKLGSEFVSTSFPTPFLPANVSLQPGSTVAYQAGPTQSIESTVSYQNLILESLGSVASRAISATAAGIKDVVGGDLLKVFQDLFVDSTVSADFDNDIVDVDGDINGNGTFQLLTGGNPSTAFIGGNFASSVSLIAGAGTTVTYDGTGAQSIAAATYQNLTINKPSGTGTITGSGTVLNNLTLTSGNVIISGSFMIDVAASVSRTSGQFIGPLTMGLDGTTARTFHVGTPVSYLPVDVEAGIPGTVTIQAIEGLHPNKTGINTLDRYWSLVAPSSVTSLDSVQFNYSEPDYTNGVESKFRLARYSGGIWTDFGDIPETLNYGLATTVGSYLGDWVIGQKGSTGFAGGLAITSINGGLDPTVNVPFDVDVEARHDDGTAANVTLTTTADVLLFTGTGALLGSSGSITAGTSTATATGLTYDTVETGVQLTVQSASGDLLDDGFSALFDVLATPSTLTVSSLLDTGAGTLRDAIETFNSGGCPAPCTINFDVSGTGNILLSSPLPAITGTGPLTIDGYTGFGAAANTNSFGQPVSSIITVSLDGNNLAAFGLVIQSANVTIKGLGFRRFLFGGTGEAIKIDNVSGCKIAGNYIGLDNTGTLAQPNFVGIVLSGAGATLNTIGGVNTEDRNVISGNASWAISVANGATVNDILGNYIGIRPDAATGMSNGDGGVIVCATCLSTTIGTNIVGNVISGHTSGSGTGIELNGVMADVKGNRIGTSADGTTTIANNTGVVMNGDANYLGGAGPGDRNLISGNIGNGITVNSNLNEISRNWIGTDQNGTGPRPNGGHGIQLVGTAANNKIGSPQPNRIAFNNQKGVEHNTTGIGNIIQTNEIFSNIGIAIDLGIDGPTANDPTDTDTGANNRQNFPTISLAEIDVTNVDVTVSLNSSGGVSANFFVVNLYKADASTPSQASEHLGASTCLAGILTNQIVSVPLGSVLVGSKVVATATAFSDAACTTASEGTSELSPSVIVNGDVHWVNASGGPWENGANWDTGFLPAPGDNAIIDAVGTYTVTQSSGQAVKSLTIGTGVSGQQTLQVNTGPLTINSASSITSTGRLELNATIQGAGTLTNNGLITWNSGTFANAGVINATAGPAMTITNASGKILNGATLTNNVGATTFWSNGFINLQTGGNIANAGTFETNFDGLIGDAGGAGAFANTGTFRKSGGAANTTFNNIALNHSGGNIEVQQGALDLAGGTATAPINISSGKKITINSDTYIFGAGVALTGLGKVEVVTGGTLTVNTNLNFPALHVTGGLVNGSGDVVAAAAQTIIWDGGTFGTGGGKVSIGASGNLLIDTPSIKSLDRTLEILGSASALWNNGTINIGTTGLINNAGIFESTADTMVNNSGVGSATFTNTGTFKKSGGAGTTNFINAELISSNTLWVASGTVNLANATISGTVDIDPLKLLMVDSDLVTLNSPVFIDSGLLQVIAGTLTMNGPMSLPSFQFDNGIVNGSGTVTHTGPFQWNGGTLSGIGTTSIGAGGSLAIATASAKALDRTLDVQLGRTATWSGGTINVGTNGNIASSGTFDATTDNIINKSGGGTPTLTNSGTLRKSGGAGQTTFTNVDINSTGTIHVQSGILNPSNASISGIVDLDAGTKLTIDSDTVTIAGATSFPDTGSVEIQAGTLMVSNNVIIPTIVFNNGFIDGTSTLTIGTAMGWAGGTMQGSGVTEVASLAILNMSGIGKALNTRTLRPLSGSTVNWTAGNLSVNTGGNIDNTGLFHVQFDGNLGNGGSAGAFVNNNGGTLRRSATTGNFTLTGINLTNNGILDIDLGRVDVTGTFNQGATGSLDILLNGVVPGTQHGQLVTSSSATLAGPLNITLNGPYQPLVGDDFTVISWPSDTHAGNFAPYNLPALINGRTWTNLFNATGLHLVVNGGNADLSITKTPSAANVVVSSPISYTIAVSNAGPDNANGVQVVDTLPAGHTSIFASGGPTWSCGAVGLVVTCNATSPLGTGAAPNITITATAPATPGPITNTASVTTTNPDPNGANNSANANVTIDPSQADVAVTGTDPASVPVSSPVAFNFNITNNGPQTATTIVFTAPIPATLTFVSATAPCTFSTSVVTCNLGNLVSFGSTLVTINTTAPNVGTQSITGSVSAAEIDPTAGNDNLTLSVAVSGATVVVTNTDDAGAGSLRQALLDAQNAVCTAPCTIAFNVATPPFAIQPLTDLPAVGNNTTVDGTTQPGYSGTPIVEIDGSALVGSPGTFVMNGTTAKLTGLSITNSNTASPGISITGNTNFVEANYIGVDPLNVAAGNDIGIAITGDNNFIGGVGGGEGNVVAYNATNGINVASSGIGNAILGNSIHTDTLLGIDLGVDGATPNDAGDADTGANNRQNSPTLTSSTLDGLGGMTITGNIDSSAAAAASIQFEFFEADAAGEGMTFISRACVAGNSFGLGSSFAVPGFIAVGDSVVATATAYSDAACTTVADGTSEFSNVVVTTLCTPPPAVLTAPPSVCTGATNAAASVNAPSAVSFNWVPTNATITGGQGTSAITFNPGLSGSVTLAVTVTDASGCVNTVNSTFPVTPTPVVTITGPTATCAGTPVTLDAGVFSSYLWSNGSTAQTLTVSPGTTQTYSVIVTDASGCTGTDSHTVTVSSNPTATVTAPAAVCTISTGNTASVATQAGAVYAWTIANGAFTSSSTGPSVTFSAGSVGNVTLGVTVTVGSCTSTGSAIIPISAAPVVTIAGPTQVCALTSFTLNAGAGFNTYLWSNGSTSSSITGTQSAASQVYSVTVTNAAGCATTTSHTVTLLASPSATITAPATAIENTPGLAASVAVQAGATYNWGIINGSITAGLGTNAITFTAGPGGVTQLSIIVTLSGCTAIDTHNVILTGNAADVADVGITKTAAASVPAGGTLVYTINATNHGPGDAPTVQILDPLPAGTSLVSIDDGALNCGSFPTGIFCSGSLAANASTTISITVKAPLNVPQVGTTITNIATLDAGVNDPNANNDVASASTQVIGAPSECADVPPSLLLPLNGGNSNSPVTFSWTSVAGVLEYELWIVTGETTSLAGTTSTTSLTIPLASGPTNWYVVARLGGVCGPLVSDQRTVNVLQANGCATHVTPQLTSPAANGTAASPVTFSWTPVPGAIGYRLWIEVNGTTAQDLGTTDGAITLTADVPPGSVTAYVDALFNGCPDTHSSEITFNVPRPDPCAGRTTATLLAPANNSVVNSSLVHFAWTDANADGYRLWLSIEGGLAEVAGTTDDTSLQTTIEFGSVEWWIENLYDGCGSIESQHSHFTIPPRGNCPTTAPQLLSPIDGVAVTSANVTFNWTSVANAVSYELWLSSGGATPTLIGTTTGTSLTHLVAPGALQWFVRAIVDRCPSPDSANARFLFTPTDACRNHQPPHAITPLPNAHVVSPVDFAWSQRPGATSYELYVVRGANAPQLVLTTANTFASGVALQSGNLRWFVRANAADCSPLDSAERQLEIVATPQPCADLVPPRISAPGQISNGKPFLLQWDEIPGATAYQLQTAANSAFTNAELLTTSDNETTLTQVNQGSTPLSVFARVRAIDARCTPEPTITPYGPTAAIFILPAGGVEGSAPLTGGNVTHFIQLGPELAGQSFVATVREPWLIVIPSSGVVPVGGTSLAVTANTNDLPVGTSLATVQITLNSSARGIGTNATTFKAPTMSVSKVTPVTPTPKSTPPPDALIIPAVAHANGINSQFQSDVRVTNSSAQLLQYQATFTPSGVDGLAAGRQTTFSIDPGRTIALDDVLRGWFGTGGESVTGTLEIRPITETATSTSSAPLSGLADLVTFAASRTFNVTSNGTFGQYIPATPFANFIGGATELAPASALALQQIAQSDRYRTNLGIVEGSGDAASLLVKVFGSDGQKLTEFPVQLAGGQHTQLNSFLSTNGVGNLVDGRVEISVIGGSGKVTAYASVLDNATSDPLLVTPVTLTEAGNTKWVVPGVADLNNGTANWQTDMRLFNAGTTDVDAVLTFYSQNGGTPHTANVIIPAGQVRQFDKALASVFGTANDGGAIHIATSTASRLVATARTYNQTSTGTYGQFISGVTPSEATGVGSRPLQILQVEETNRFRSNIGLAEVTGNPIKLEIAVIPPDAKFTVITEVQLQANEFRQINALLRSIGLADTYNARVSVRAIEGNGRVTAYASVIDMLTNDPTYVPAQ